MSRFRPLLAASAASLALVTMTPAVVEAAPAPAATSASVGCTRQLEAAVQTHLNAITNRDLDAYAATLHDDIVLILPNGSRIEGKDAVVALHEELFADTSWRQDFLDVQSQTFGCKTAWTRVEYNYIVFNPDGTELGRAHSLFTLSWTREKGKWRVIADQNTRIS